MHSTEIKSDNLTCSILSPKWDQVFHQHPDEIGSIPFGDFLVTSQHPSPQELPEQQPWPAPIDHLEPENPNNQKRSVPNQHKRMNRQFLGEYPSTF
jgi:hypothetical protein